MEFSGPEYFLPTEWPHPSHTSCLLVSNRQHSACSIQHLNSDDSKSVNESSQDFRKLMVPWNQDPTICHHHPSPLNHTSPSYLNTINQHWISFPNQPQPAIGSCGRRDFRMACRRVAWPKASFVSCRKFFGKRLDDECVYSSIMLDARWCKTFKTRCQLKTY